MSNLLLKLLKARTEADKPSVVSCSFYMIGHHLMDPQLRLLPQRGATPIPNVNLKKE